MNSRDFIIRQFCRASLVCAIFTPFAYASVPLAPFDTNTLDGILVSIGEDVILLSDLQHDIAATSHSQTTLQADGKLVGGTVTVKQANQILQNLIDQKILHIKAVELGFDISDDELSARIDAFLKQQGYTENDLLTQLQHGGKSLAEYRLEFKNEVLKQQLIGRFIAPLVNVTDDEVNNFYLQQTKNVKQISTVTLRSLLIHIPEDSLADPLNFPAVKTVQQKIKEGVPFVELVKQYSMASDAAQTGGKLPPRSVAELPPMLRDQITNLEVGQILGPFAIGSSVFFFQYLSAEFGVGSDLKKNFADWKGKLQNIKFSERLTQYLSEEKEKLKVNARPFEIH